MAEKKVTTSPFSRGEKGKRILIDPYVSHSKSRIVRLSRHQPSQKFIPTSHHCGKIWHIRHKCFQLNTHELKRGNSCSRNSYEELFNMTRAVMTLLDDLDKSHKFVPNVKKVWVKKVDSIHPLRESGSGLT